jgi:hypothetical protein
MFIGLTGRNASQPVSFVTTDDQPLSVHFFKLYTGGLSANIFMRDAGL